MTGDLMTRFSDIFKKAPVVGNPTPAVAVETVVVPETVSTEQKPVEVDTTAGAQTEQPKESINTQQQPEETNVVVAKTEQPSESKEPSAETTEAPAVAEGNAPATEGTVTNEPTDLDKTE